MPEYTDRENGWLDILEFCDSDEQAAIADRALTAIWSQANLLAGTISDVTQQDNVVLDLKHATTIANLTREITRYQRLLELTYETMLRTTCADDPDQVAALIKEAHRRNL